MPRTGERIFTPLEGAREHRILDYKSAFEAELERPPAPWKRFPSVMVGWDNTPRRQHGATIYAGATPEMYERWLRSVVDSVSDVRPEENYLFILAWNEWAEGNHLEPDQHYGRAFLEATRAVLLEPPAARTGRPGELLQGEHDHSPGSPQSKYDYVYPFEHESAVAHAAELVRDLALGRHSTVVDLGAGTAVVSYALRDTDISYHGLDIHPVAVDLMRQAGINATQCDLADVSEVQTALDEIGEVGALMLLDVIEHLVQPQQLLAALSEWSLKHNEPALVVSVPNATHFDLGLRLLCGRWVPTERGLLDSTHLRFFTEQTLDRLFRRCGWRVVARNDFSTLRTDQYDAELNDALPTEMIGALNVLARTYNPNAAVQQFVWTLKPFPVATPPTTFLQAVGDVGGPVEEDSQSNESQAVRNYLASVGLIASETNRRAAKHLRSGVTWRGKRIVLRTVSSSPRLTRAVKRARGWLP
jgi:2-polyprenyl-3-methyl-5-hydroxy-6-metoxy-1,4-benzoquinol methylase